ncbi:MAG: glycogen/starch synthase [Chitinispirillaceae bacterium]|nr:glycogen/starch synthase [Chitinispirillaceae bacterium]
MSTHHDNFNYLFHTKLDSWTPLTASMHDFFNDEEIGMLDRSNRTFHAEKRTVVILSFENRFALLGGLGAVVRRFPASLRKQGEKVLLLTPLHCGCSAVSKAIAENELVRRFAGVEVHFGNYSCTVSCYQERGAAVPTYHIGVDGRFRAGENPYGYADQNELLYDSLVFCAVVPSVLSYMGHDAHLLFHAHDWETAPIALFARCAVISAVLRQVKTILTLHNSFDAPFPDRFKRLFFNRIFGGCTVLQSMLPFFHGPITAVSTPYAHELRHDPLQRGFFVDHLQRLFSMNPPIGIENGMFGEPTVPLSDHEASAAAEGDYRPLLERKRAWRNSFVRALHREKDPRIIGELNDATLEDPAVPLLFMSGRLDLMQKGFDVVFHAFSRLKPGSAQLFFTPTLHHGDDDLSFFAEGVTQCKGNIVIWPYWIHPRKYRTLLQGASYLIMPSLYEPYGAASEGLLHGTPVIARATGGLLAQLEPGDDFAVPPEYAAIFPGKTAEKRNGIFFKESFPDNEAEKMWRTLLRLPVRQRIDNTLYRSIVDAAYTALTEATGLFADRSAYGSMVFHGLTAVQRNTWDEAARKYRAVYDVSAARGW